MSRYQPYPSYKDSGVEWLGETPEHWEISKIKYIASIFGRIGFRGYTTADIVDEGMGAITLSPSNLQNGKMTYENVTYLSWDKYHESPEIQIKQGDTVLVKTGSTFGKIGYIDTLPMEMTLNPQLVVFKQLQCHSKYLFYLLNSKLVKSYVENSNSGSTIPTMSQEVILNYIVPLCCSDEQTSIANFLDIQTAKIDTLITKQQRMIELLGEKRSAMISYAVTKGLNPDVAMKDSGVDWLGEVPEHWAVSKFSYLSNVVRGGSPRPAGDPTLFHGDYSPWVTVAEITKDTNKYLIETETFLTKKGSEQCRIFKAGTLLLSNSGATLGVPKILNIDANANDGVVGFENLDTKIAIEFAYFYLFSLTDNLRDRMNQGSGQPNLNTDIVKAISIPLPPFDEQNEIIAFLDVQTAKIDTLIAKARQAIELMKERRTALISAAVTGKIDVREYSVE